MMKIKVFHADSAEDLQDAVNEWLKENHNTVFPVHVTQTESGDFSKGEWGITYTIFYKR